MKKKVLCFNVIFFIRLKYKQRTIFRPIIIFTFQSSDMHAFESITKAIIVASVISFADKFYSFHYAILEKLHLFFFFLGYVAIFVFNIFPKFAFVVCFPDVVDSTVNN